VIFAIDPGPERSALVVFDGTRVVEHWTYENQALLDRISDRTRRLADVLVIEQVASMGMAVGAEVFETVFWSGRFVQAWAGYHATMPWDRVKRHEVKLHLCNSMRAKDPNIRQALLDRFGGKAGAIGSKASPGPLYGVKGDEWAALAVAITWTETRAPQFAGGGHHALAG
jgi:hypothetical protein